MSICKEDLLCIWGFDETREQVYHKFDLNRQVMSIIVTQEIKHIEPVEVPKIEEIKEVKPVEDKKEKKNLLKKNTKATVEVKVEEKVVVEPVEEKVVIEPIKSQQLLICFKKGDTEILVWNNETKELCELQEKDKSDEHEDVITCCDSM